MVGFVYLARATGGGPIKIGRSKAPDARVRSLRKERGDRSISIVDCVLFSDEGRAHAFEQTLHRRLAAARVEGEWFALDRAAIMAAARALAERMRDDGSLCCIAVFSPEKRSKAARLMSGQFPEDVARFWGFDAIFPTSGNPNVRLISGNVGSLVR